MLKITKYGEKIQEVFLEHCKIDGTYQRVFEDLEDGTCLLEPSVRGIKDYAAWCLITYGTDAINTVNEWKEECDGDICWSTNWRDLDNAFTITCTDLLVELNKALAEPKEDMSIQLTLTGDEIEQLEQVTCINIVDKEGLYQAVLTAIEKYVETYKED